LPHCGHKNEYFLDAFESAASRTPDLFSNPIFDLHCEKNENNIEPAIVVGQIGRK
jgi:hypothetical protein